jgi:7 transmembrane sweet-taste receptor of 3 GCPR
VDPTTGDVVSTKGECVSNSVIYYLVPILCIIAVYIIGGLSLAWRNRNTPTEFSEGRYVSGAILTDTELLIIGVPIIVIANSNPLASFMVKVSFIFLSVGATVAVFFYPKFAILHGFWTTQSEGLKFLAAQGSSKKASSDRPTPKHRSNQNIDGKSAPESPFHSSFADQSVGSAIEVRNGRGSSFDQTSFKNN